MTSLEAYEPHITQELVDRAHARRMDLLEDYFAMMERQKMYKNFSLYGKLSQPFTTSQLANALRAMLSKYPILASVVIPKNFDDYQSFYTSKEYYSQPYPVRDFIKIGDQIELSDVLLNEQDEHKEVVDQIFDEFISSDYNYTGRVAELVGSIFFPEFDGKRPNWRILCLPYPGGKDTGFHSQVIYVSNHCLSDGISAVNFMEQLAVFLADKESTEKTDFVILDYSKDWQNISKLPPSITTYVDYKPNLIDIPKLLMSGFIKDHLSYKSDALLTARLSPSEPQRYHNLMKFTGKDVSTFKTAVKGNVHGQCTLTPFFNACFLVSLHRYGKFFKKSWTEWTFDVALASNTRKYLPEDTELRDRLKFGPHIGGLHYPFLISSFDINYDEKEKFWNLVDYYYTLFSDDHNSLIGLGILMSDQLVQKKNLDNLICQEYLGRKRGGLLLSNVGHHSQDTTNAQHITDMVFSQTAGALKFTFAMNMVSTNVGGLNIDMNIARSAIPDKQDLMDFCNEFEKVLRNFTC